MFTLPVFAASTVNSQPTYVDKKFGFSLQLPIGWVALPHTSIHNTQYADVVFTNSKLPGTHLEVNVLRSSTAATTFAQQGKPTVRIGNYPAFQQDTPEGVQMPIPCLGRTMLVHNDIVTASWCAKDAATHKQAFESILATYRDHSTASTKTSTVVQAQTPVNTVLNCGQVISSGENSWGTLPTSSQAPNFGQQIVNPTDATWMNNFGEGVAVCNDDGWEGSYLFQCVELANRLIHEEWNLPGFNGDAFAYYDNYQNGTYYNGLARASGYNATLTPDASQGSNSALPVPGDLIIFQDVNTPSQGWASGEIPGDAGHVVVVTSVTSSQVNVVQQNWLNGEIHSFSWSQGSNGYHIQDNSGESHRITRGWIHFGANTNGGGGGISTTSSPVAYNLTYNHPEVFAINKSDGTIWHDWPDSSGNWTNWTQTDATHTFQGTPAVIWNAGQQHLEVFALGKDGHIYHDWPTSTGWNNWTVTDANYSFQSSPSVAYNMNAGYPEVFAIATDGTMWHDWFTSTGWNNWHQTDATHAFQGNPAAIWNAGAGNPEVFAILKASDSTNGTMWHDWPDSSGNWTNWTQTDATHTFKGSPAIAYNQTYNYPEVFAISASDGTMWHDWFNATTAWANWTQTDATHTFQGNPALVWNTSTKNLESFALDTSGHISFDYPSSTGFWNNWTEIDAADLSSQNSPAAVYNPSSNAPEVFAPSGSDGGTVYHSWTDPTGNWAPWHQTQSGLTFQW